MRPRGETEKSKERLDREVKQREKIERSEIKQRDHIEMSEIKQRDHIEMSK